MAKRFKEVKQLDYPGTEVEIQKWWEQNSIFDKSISSREDGIPFNFYEGPPTANGKPGIHHVMSRTVKDLFCRYKTLKGYKVTRKGGWDTHGLPVEIEVEKELGLEGREQVEEYGIAAYNEKCRESVLRYKDLWDDLTRRMGYWIDLEDPYITFDNRYIESIWWSLKTLYEKGYLYKGYKIQWYSPGSGTVLSSHEVSLGYEEIQDPSVFIRFPVKGESGVYFLAWTTTPWTVVSNMVLAVHPEIEYARVKVPSGEGSETLILARELLDTVLGEDSGYEVLQTLAGRDLVGMDYEPVFTYASRTIDEDQAWRVVPADMVTLDEGTGVVHMAPAFGADDHEVCQREGVPMFNPIQHDGCFDETVEDFAGQWFKHADKNIIRELKQRGLLLRHETYVHNYPHDWRKGTPLMSYPVESWFVETTRVKDRMVEYNRKINWKPESTGTGRFGVWLENNVDWALSRQRYWGTPLPIWVNDQDPEEVECIGSVEQLREKAGLPEDRELDLHRPYIDEITWKGRNGGTMRRVPDLIDVWYDSGAMPFAQWHYPFENQELFKENFPADFIAEGVDQTRGWFYTLHALGTLLFDSPAYQSVVSNGLVLDAKGEKMSKSKGNVVDPFDVIQRYGADTVRWYMIANSAPWDDLKFSEAGLDETRRKFFNTIINTYSFFAIYANIDGFTYSGAAIPIADRPEMDRWIISRQFSIIKKVDTLLEDYEPTHAAREVEQFVDELSNWYVRRSRRRFWKQEKSLDKTAAYQTLCECLFNLAKVMSPIAPFVSEWLYQRLNEVTGRDEESVHISFYPTVEETAIDKALEHRMHLARTVSTIVHRVRNRVGINVRRPLKKIIVPISNKNDQSALDSVKTIILDEVNVKSVEYVDDDSQIVHKSAKPNFPVVGKKHGKKMKAITSAVSNLTSGQLSEFEEKGSITLDLGDQGQVELVEEDLQIQRVGLEGWSVETEQGVTVAVDTELTPELRNEGMAREFINRVQNMRKEADYEVTDRIDVAVKADKELVDAVKSMASYVRQETLSVELVEGKLDGSEHTREWDIDGHTCKIAIRRNNK